MMVEIPSDIALEEVAEETIFWGKTFKNLGSEGNPRDVEPAAQALCSAKYPVIHAGQGVLYAGASEELVELAELLSAPVMSTLLGKSAFPETHPLALGSGSGVMSGPLHHFMRRADLVFGIGCSFTRHGMSMNIPPGKTMIHATNDSRDINKDYNIDYPIVGDAKLVLRQLLDGLVGGRGSPAEPGPEVTELLGELSMTKMLEGTTLELGWAVHAHPSLSEMVKEAALSAQGRAIHM